MSEATEVFAERHALITGGGRGLGAAIAARLAAGGARVTLVGRDRAALEATAARLPASARAQVLACDVADSHAVASAFAAARAALGGIDILVNNAGQASSAPIHRTDDALWRRMQAVNLDGVFFCARAALPDMLAEKWGRVIAIASTAGQRGYPYVSAYVAAKHGVIGLTRALALEVAARGVTVNAVCPGYTETDLLAASLANVVAKTGRTVEEARAEFLRANPQGRFVDPAEVAETVAFLCSPLAAAINGQSISVSGGEVM